MGKSQKKISAQAENGAEFEMGVVGVEEAPKLGTAFAKIKSPAYNAIMSSVDKKVVERECNGELEAVDISAQAISKLEVAYKVGADDTEARLFAGLSESRFELVLQKYTLLPRYIESWKAHMELKARGVLSKALDAGDIATAKWFLERKKRGEFGNKLEIESHRTLRKEITVTVQDVKKFRDMIPVRIEGYDGADVEIVDNTANSGSALPSPAT